MIDFGALCGALEAEGLTRVFGVPGTQTLGLFDAIRRSNLEFTLASHELGAAFMANGYFRACGMPSVVATIGGPGFTNALTGIAEASLDSVALLHIVSAPATAPGERFQLQAIDQPAIAAPLVKACYDLSPGDDLREVAVDAVARALGGEPGPVLIQYGQHDPSLSGSSTRPEAVESELVPEQRLLDEFRDLWSRAIRPVFLAGQGAVSEATRLRRIVESAGIPVVTTPSARGIIPEDHPLSMGFDVLRGGVQTLNEFFERSDLIVALGCKLGHNGSAGFRLDLPSDLLIRVDTSQDVLDVNYPAVLSLEAPVAEVLTLVEDKCSSSRRTDWSEEELAAVRSRLRTLPSSLPDPVVSGPAVSRASAFFSWLRDFLPRDAILVTDSGLHQVLARRYFEVLEARGLSLPSDFQSMGFGIPAGVGAKLGAPKRPVAVLVGDGGFLMSGMEITTAVRDQIPLLVIVFNDGHLNQIRLQQLADSGQSFGVDLPSIDIRKFADGIGAEYRLFDEFGGTGAGLDSLDGNGPTIMEVRIGDSWAMRSRAAGAKLKDVARSIRDARTANPGTRKR